VPRRRRIDPPHVIAARCATGAALCDALCGEHVELSAVQARRWGWLVADFCGLGRFTYEEIKVLAPVYVAEHGIDARRGPAANELLRAAFKAWLWKLANTQGRVWRLARLPGRGAGHDAQSGVGSIRTAIEAHRRAAERAGAALDEKVSA